MNDSRTRLLITGSSGFVGRNLVEYFRERSDLHLADLVEPEDGPGDASWQFMDIRDADSVGNVMREVRPDAVIHAAANKNVRWCQSHPDEAMLINAEGTSNVADQCRRIKARMVYISTDLVFDCGRGNYRDSETPHPGTVYGRTKLEGERRAAQQTQELAICRSGGIYGRHSPLLGWISDSIGRGKTVECFTDVYNSPTYAVNLAEMIEYILRTGLSGIFHTVGTDRVNRYELFQSFAETFRYDTSLLVPAEAGADKEKMLLVPDASLSTDGNASKIRVTFDPLREGMSRLLAAGGIR